MAGLKKQVEEGFSSFFRNFLAYLMMFQNELCWRQHYGTAKIYSDYLFFFSVPLLHGLNVFNFFSKLPIQHLYQNIFLKIVWLHLWILFGLRFCLFSFGLECWFFVDFPFLICGSDVVGYLAKVGYGYYKSRVLPSGFLYKSTLRAKSSISQYWDKVLYLH